MVHNIDPKTMTELPHHDTNESIDNISEQTDAYI